MKFRLTSNRCVEAWKINKNMRCIEIELSNLTVSYTSAINKNMRCIEIREVNDLVQAGLKINKNMRCIEIREDEKYPKQSR